MKQPFNKRWHGAEITGWLSRFYFGHALAFFLFFFFFNKEIKKRSPPGEAIDRTGFRSRAHLREKEGSTRGEGGIEGRHALVVRSRLHVLTRLPVESGRRLKREKLSEKRARNKISFHERSGVKDSIRWPIVDARGAFKERGEESIRGNFVGRISARFRRNV